MRRLALLLVPAALFAGQARYARLGEFEGQVDVQLQAADAWMPAERNLPLPESAWLRTGPSSRVEIELDEGSVLRLGPDSQVELSDYATLSTGQRVTVLSLDHGLAYFSGESKGKDALTVAVPGAQVTFIRAARVRLEAQETWSQIAVLEGVVRFSSPAAELDLEAGRTTRVEPANPSRFFLHREVASMTLDRWNDSRDKALASPPSAGHVLEHDGLADLDAAGEWIQTDDLGAVWKPKVAEGWAPFQKGRWLWYDTLGYTWVSQDPWGWLPYHYGRWAQRERNGWVWAPSVSTVFKPGEVYWLRQGNLVGWGPLGPGEQWTPPDAPRQFLSANTTWASFELEGRVIDPAGFTTRPKEALPASAFTAALPSPAFVASRLDATRPILRAGSTRITPVLRGVTFPDNPNETAEPEPPRPAPPSPQPPVMVVRMPAPEPPPPVEVEVPVAVPVLAGILVLNAPGTNVKTATLPNPATPPASATTKGARPRGTPRVPPSVKPPEPAELDHYNQALADLQTPAKQLQDLEAWTHAFPRSAYQNDRAYLYMQAYSRMSPPQQDKVIEIGAQLMNRGLALIFPDRPQAVLGVLYLMSAGIGGMRRPSVAQLSAGRFAAQQLVLYTPLFFTDARKPPELSRDDWKRARADAETAAQRALEITAR